jgi:hypothetical protein
MKSDQETATMSYRAGNLDEGIGQEKTIHAAQICGGAIKRVSRQAFNLLSPVAPNLPFLNLL